MKTERKPWWQQGALTVVLIAVLLGACSSGQSDDRSEESSTPPPSTERLIEEGDIVWLDDPILYVLSKTNGLRVVGLGNPAAPTVIGRVPIVGTPVELYVRDGIVLALTSGVSGTTSILGSRLSVVEVATPEQARLVAQVSLQGTVGTSRLVGEVLYTASDAGAVVQSVNLANPRSPWLVDKVTLPLGTSNSHVLATPTTLYIATANYTYATDGECYGNEGCTTITAVDISSPTGAIRRGASYTLAGTLKDRFAMDHYDGILRMVVARGRWWTSTTQMSATIRTFLAGTPDELSPLGYTSLKTDRYENVMAVRFDGPRGYVVTFMQTDPLFTLDLSNPTNPRVVGHLMTPGWLDYIIPRGDRVLGIGRDRGSNGQWQLQASLYDVSQLSAPIMLKRIPFGGNYSTLPDQADNLAKVVRVIDSLGVLLVPHNSTQVGYSGNATEGRLEIIQFDQNTLSTLGVVTSTDPVLRAVPLPPSHVAAVTDNAVGIIELSTPVQVVGETSLR
jgi:hypothetical protein